MNERSAANNQPFVEWINEGLKNTGKTRRGLAAILHVDPSIVTRIIQGKRRVKADELMDISRYLEVPPPWPQGTNDEAHEVRTVG